mmetsp:Transcript_29522/g.49861  ORF Transcript_29522/g.49861 Transcript_29522/m.49861 type:complete len:234 (-) Transcript_29522:2408-3109(-)|eukprot:CAMPEP_0114428014 /NCGR_PEP_ID=MMETSP0103-20121206/8690_1 /TAXON_ID=37642 ORGANISM="Paraphysomonas imperforata, Strain PA2" /NCGR_SAMPLE_ID=MMETSP0103 /ASSEMBLY_ACC=CAM_ASM_000201 /LENGTH=233 /DNA_ID=CAMNT_0001597183 /DNA_START=32 /DNA_END=733 /DNA_ORIENTATION=+
MINPKSVIPLHGIVWIQSQKSLAVVKKPEHLGSRVECILISSAGLEFKNLCNFIPSGIIDAAPMLKAFEETFLNSEDSPFPTGGDVTSMAIGVALLEAANKVLGYCEKNKRYFPWNVICPDICLRPLLAEASFASPRDAYEESYASISTLLVERDIAGYMTEVAKADDYQRFPSKYNNAVPAAVPARESVTSASQNTLRNYVKVDSEATANGIRKFIEYDTEDAIFPPKIQRR